MNMIRFELVALTAILGLAIAGCSKDGYNTTQENSPPMATTTDGIQKASIIIEGGRYNPSIVSVEKGKPVELTFIGGKELGCGGTIVFKSLNMSKDVEPGKTVTFKFTPQEAGDIAFTCGMGMYDGKVVVK